MNKLVKVFLSGAIILSSSFANASMSTDSAVDIETKYMIKLGGFSKHIYTPKYGVDYDFNETHEGFGVSVLKDFDKEKANNVIARNFDSYSYDVYWMKESFNQDQFQAGMTFYKTKEFGLTGLHSVSLGMATGLMSRSYGKINPRTGKIKSTKRILTPYILPGLTVHFTEMLHIDMTFIPEMGEANKFPVVFARGGLTF